MQLNSLAESSRHAAHFVPEALHYATHFAREKFTLRCLFCSSKICDSLLLWLAEIRATCLTSLAIESPYASHFSRQSFALRCSFRWLRFALRSSLCSPRIRTPQLTSLAGSAAHFARHDSRYVAHFVKSSVSQAARVANGSSNDDGAI